MFSGKLSYTDSKYKMVLARKGVCQFNRSKKQLRKTLLFIGSCLHGIYASATGRSRLKKKMSFLSKIG